MVNKYWLDKLISPQSGQKLIPDVDFQHLCTPDGKEVFPIVKGVPRLLIPEPETIVSNSEIHQKLHTSFRYREHYQQDAEVFDYFLAYEDGASRHEARRLHEMIVAAVPEDAALILDVGCGNAWVASHFCPRNQGVISLDIASRNPEKAWDLYPFSNHLPLVADVYALPFSKDSIDCIIASEIIEHVADPKGFLEKLLDVLRPGGTLILTTPFAEKISHSLCVHCNRPTPQHAHLHSFTKDSLVRIVRKDQASTLKMKTFSNKALTKLQTHVFLQYLPTTFWKVTDQLANWIVQKPARLMMTVKK